MARNATSTFDGLVVGYGTHSADNDVGSVYQGAGGVVTYTMEIVMADLVDTFSATEINPHSAAIPRGSAILSAYIHSLIAPTSGDSATLDIGFWSADLSTPVVDTADGLVADVTVAEFGLLGESIQLDGDAIADSATAAGGVQGVGQTSNSDVLPAPSRETGTFTAGIIRLVINYLPPSGSFGRTVAV